MSIAAQCVKTLIQEMVLDHKDYIALNQLLEQQRKMIIAASPDIAPLNQQIIEIYQRLAQRSRHRYRLMSQLGIPVCSHGLQALFSRLPAAQQSRLNALWDDLQNRAAQCKVINDYNGTLLNMQREIWENVVNSSVPENWLYREK